jgi:hypothetical protein
MWLTVKQTKSLNANDSHSQNLNESRAMAIRIAMLVMRGHNARATLRN